MNPELDNAATKINNKTNVWLYLNKDLMKPWYHFKRYHVLFENLLFNFLVFLPRDLKNSVTLKEFVGIKQF